MRSVDQIMAARGRDTLFLRFRRLMFGDDPAAEQARVDHFAWLRSQGIEWETAAPRGWQEGDPAIYYIAVEPDDPRIAEYSSRYEHPDGSSLHPDRYAMVIMIYAAWLARRQQDNDDTYPITDSR